MICPARLFFTNLSLVAFQLTYQKNFSPNSKINSCIAHEVAMTAVPMLSRCGMLFASDSVRMHAPAASFVGRLFMYEVLVRNSKHAETYN